MVKNLVLWLVIAAVLLAVFQNFNPKVSQEPLTYSEFVKEIQADKVREVTVDGLIILGVRNDNSRFEAVRPQIADDR